MEDTEVLIQLLLKWIVEECGEVFSSNPRINQSI